MKNVVLPNESLVSACAEAGSNIQLAPGIYQVSSTLGLAPGCRLISAGIDRTIIQMAPGPALMRLYPATETVSRYRT